MRLDPETEALFGADIPLVPPQDYLELAVHFRDEAWDEMADYFQTHPSIYDTDFNFDGLMFPHPWSLDRAAASFCVIVHQIGTDSEVSEWYDALSAVKDSVLLVNDENEPLTYAQLGKVKFAFFLSRFERACQLFEQRSTEFVMEHLFRAKLGLHEIVIERMRKELVRIS